MQYFLQRAPLRKDTMLRLLALALCLATSLSGHKIFEVRPKAFNLVCYKSAFRGCGVRLFLHTFANTAVQVGNSG